MFDEGDCGNADESYHYYLPSLILWFNSGLCADSCSRVVMASSSLISSVAFVWMTGYSSFYSSISTAIELYALYDFGNLSILKSASSTTSSLEPSWVSAIENLWLSMGSFGRSALSILWLSSIFLLFFISIVWLARLKGFKFAGKKLHNRFLGFCAKKLPFGES